MAEFEDEADTSTKTEQPMKRESLTKMIPPYWFALGAVSILIIDRLLPELRLNPLALDAPAGWQWIGGGLLFSLSGLLASSAFLLFQRRDTTVDPFDDASSLVTDGPFRLSRNPMYLALACLLASLSVALTQPLGVIVIAAFIMIINHRHIGPEEARLLAHFGEDFRDYQRRVRRWI